MMWVAVGSVTNPNSGIIAYSTDNGVNWQRIPGTEPFTRTGLGVAWNGKMWVAVGSGTTNTIAYSSDGIIWTGIQGPFTKVNATGEGGVWNNLDWKYVGCRGEYRC